MHAVPPISAIRRGTPVAIVLKADQRTGVRVSGTVADILTRGNHPRGIKVRLSDGRIGRVQAIMSSSSSSPWSQQQQQSQQHPQQSGVLFDAAPRQPPRPPVAAGAGTGHGYMTSQQQQQQQQQQQPPLDDRSADLIDPSDRAAQVETFESFENSRAMTREESDRASLGREFAQVDGSLIAAIYGDSEGDMSYCREMLQALSSPS